MRRSWTPFAWVALLVWAATTSAYGQFDDFPDDAGGSSRPPPRAPAAAPAEGDPFDADFGGASSTGRGRTAPAAPAPENVAPSASAQPAAAPTESLRPPASQDELDPGVHAVRLRALEQRVQELKERIFRSKARLALLAESVLEGLSAGARARIVHEDAMGPSYRLVRATYAIDGAPVFNRQDDEGSFGELDEFDVFEGSIVPGEHTLSVTLEYRGHGFGVFSYLRGYRFRTRASYPFSVPDGREITIRVTGFEDGGPNVALEDRPALRFGQRIVSIDDAEARDAAAAAQADEGASAE
jgi:hypothetical protein